VHVWNSSLPFQQQQDGMSNKASASGGYGLLFSRNKSYDWGDALINQTLAYPLSLAPLSQKVYYISLISSVTSFKSSNFL
jgi:hypothetical protein